MGDWHWEPDADLKPRREIWGGLLAALTGLYVYAAWIRRDQLVRRLTFWGLLAGGIGFAGGQCVQAFHPWIVGLFRGDQSAGPTLPINWWNMMETTFGAIFGGILALGLWRNRHLISSTAEPSEPELPPPAEWSLVVVHLAAVVVWNFWSFAFFDHFADLAITMVIIPVSAVYAGRLWPYFVALPIVAIPIAGKTFRELCCQGAPGAVAEFAPGIGWLVYVVVPVGIVTAAAVLFARKATTQGGAGNFARVSLLLTTWLYFSLNFAFFRLPWPWNPVGEWTGRTPNGIIFLVCGLGLTVAAGYRIRSSNRQAERDLEPSPGRPMGVDRGADVDRQSD